MLLYIKRKARESVLLLLVRCLRLSHCPRSPNEQLQEAHAVRITTKYTYCKNKGVLRYLHTPQTSTVAFVLTSIQKFARFQTAKDKKRGKRLFLIYIVSVTSCAWLWLYKDSENCIISKLFYKRNNAISAVSYYERPLELLELWIERRNFI